MFARQKIMKKTRNSKKWNEKKNIVPFRKYNTNIVPYLILISVNIIFLQIIYDYFYLDFSASLLL